MSIYITLDYELFMGNKTGSVERCLIMPTERLISVLETYGVKATFFVDASFLYIMNKKKHFSPKLKHDFDAIIRQLSDLKRENYDIQLHIHPQWYYADYDGIRWYLNEKYYKLSDLPKDKAFQLFHESKVLLETIIGDKVSAYRAGGYSIQSYNGIEHLFEDMGIVTDSSVLPGKVCDNGTQYYDFRLIQNNGSYYFTADIAKPEPYGRFLELPITTGKLSHWDFYSKYILFRLCRLDKHIFGDGTPIHSGKHKDNACKKIFEVNKVWRTASIDTGVIFYLKTLYKKNKENKNFVIIGHPKNLSFYSLRILERFLQSTDKSDYKTIRSTDFCI